MCFKSTLKYKVNYFYTDLIYNLDKTKNLIKKLFVLIGDIIIFVKK